MNEIVCPDCQKAFKVDESGYAPILKQMPDKDFEKQLAGRISALEDVNTLAKELAVTNAKSALETERTLLRAELKGSQMAQQLAVTNALAEATKKHDKVQKDLSIKLQFSEQTIENLRYIKLRLSTKILGETLEQHCETEFSRIRADVFPYAYFEKDNDATGGNSKGDYIFEEKDEAGTKIVSIMFEMKNENDDFNLNMSKEDYDASREVRDFVGVNDGDFYEIDLYRHRCND